MRKQIAALKSGAKRVSAASQITSSEVKKIAQKAINNVDFNKIMGEREAGIGALYRGEYDSAEVYYYTSSRRDIVIASNGNLYITKNPNKSGGDDWLEPGVENGWYKDWEEFTQVYDSFATGLLLTKDAVITQVLTMGSDARDGIIISHGIASRGNYNSAGDGFYLGHDYATGKSQFRVGLFAGAPTPVTLQSGISYDGVTGTCKVAGEVTITNPEDFGSFIIRSDFEPSTRPDGSSLQEGDIWIDTDNGDTIYTWDGSDWIQGYTIIDGGNIITGSITADKIDVESLFTEEITIQPTGHIKMGQTAFNTGIGFFLGDDSGTPKFSIGNPATKYLYWDGANFVINGTAISEIGSGTDPSIQGWQHDIPFSVGGYPNAYRSVVWTSGGTIWLTDGTTYSITASGTNTTGLMAASTVYYIYLDVAISTTALQVSTTASNAVGKGKILIAACQANSDTTKNAIFQVFGGRGGISTFITANNIAANTITANEISANTITANELNVSVLSAISADLGTITAGTITGATVQTASSKKRVVIDSTNTIKIYDDTAQRLVIYADSNVGYISGSSDNLIIGNNTLEAYLEFEKDGDIILSNEDGNENIILSTSNGIVKTIGNARITGSAGYFPWFAQQAKSHNLVKHSYDLFNTLINSWTLSNVTVTEQTSTVTNPAGITGGAGNGITKIVSSNASGHADLVISDAGSYSGYFGVELYLKAESGSTTRTIIQLADASNNILHEKDFIALSDSTWTKIAFNNDSSLGFSTALKIVIYPDYGTTNTIEVYGLYVYQDGPSGGLAYTDQYIPTAGIPIEDNIVYIHKLLVGTERQCMLKDALYVNGNQVVATQGAAVSNVSGTAGASYTSTERNMINDLKGQFNTLLSRLRTHGLIAT